MLILYELIHSLAKEEKRLYQLHKRDTRFQRIYEGYQRALQFSKELDQQLYADHFADVSRAFYSMQKRALMDDILAVLREYSNTQQPGYQFIRLYGRAQVLLERGMGEAAAAYGREAYDAAQGADDAERQALALQLQQAALLQSAEPSLAQYDQLLRLEQALAQQLGARDQLLKLRHSLRLLKLNVDALEPKALLVAAQGYYDQLRALPGLDYSGDPGADLDLQLDRLQGEDLYYQIIGQPEVFHRELTAFYKRLPPALAQQQPLTYYRLVNHVLESGLRSGDFLLLTGMTYKLGKEVASLRPEIARDFLPAYLENSALFSFYETDLPQALKLIDQAIRLDELGRDRLVRCIFYRLAMLVAAHLPAQAREEIALYSTTVPELADEPLLWVLEVLISIEAKESADDTLFLIERHRNALKRRKDGRTMLEALAQLSAFLERKKGRDKALRVMPADWENLLRVDLYIRAKQDSSFYYNLLLDEWKRRRKVF